MTSVIHSITAVINQYCSQSCVNITNIDCEASLDCFVNCFLAVCHLVHSLVLKVAYIGFLPTHRVIL